MTAGRHVALITGFGPFPGVPMNISGPFAHELADLDQGELVERMPGKPPHSSLRWRPVSETKTSSRVAWWVASRLSSTC